MSQKTFAQALKLVLFHEGGYVDHPQDPGGATNRGVTLAVFQRFYGASQTKSDLQAITDTQVEHIYRSGYWDPCHCDLLPEGVDYVVFDQAVNSGPGQSAKWLQMAVGVTADGKIGPETLTASRKDPVRVIHAMCDARLGFMRSLRNGALWQTFGRGWQARVDGVRTAGARLAQGTPVSDASVGGALNPVAIPSIAYEVVRKGSRGEWVEKLQTALGLTVDGVFGPQTEAALQGFQRNTGLVDDGVAGRKTYQALGLIA